MRTLDSIANLLGNLAKLQRQKFSQYIPKRFGLAFRLALLLGKLDRPLVVPDC